jgi:cytochrome c553/FtsZ-binding cell division protein ZapB
VEAQMQRLALIFLLSLCALRASGAEARTAAAVTPADRDFFEKKVRPLLFETCQKCHSTQANKRKGGLLLDSRDSLLQGGDSGPAVVPGEPEKSLLIQAVRYKTAELQMPPTNKLAPAQVAILEEWVRRGTPFPEAGSTATVRQGIDLVQGRKFWSFQPPKTTELPKVKDAAWPRQRIDTFVLAEMEKHSLTPSPTASRRTFIRRLTFDLTGLPPTPDEINAYLNDQAPDPNSRLVERLLASPSHGERWGRFWLDLVRYCDVPESWFESKGQPWFYRDWVVRAINADMPYDRFIRMQVAADLLPGTEPRDRAALGFLGLSPTYWKELKLDPTVIRTVVAEEWEERIQTLTGSVLGLTVACARCHDHKFDPISTQDYYALAGILASTRQVDRSVLGDAETATITQAHGKVQQLQKEVEQLQAQKTDQQAVRQRIEDLRRQIEQIRQSTPNFATYLAPGVDDASLNVLPDGPHKTRLEYKPGVAQDVAVQIRGNPANPGPVVPRRFIAVLSHDSPPVSGHDSGRLQLAYALVAEGAPLAARVIVNRVWKHHFGSGLVDTLSDFGAQGSRPTHPELLDDLAARFIQNGWSLKWLHREIVLSATYAQASSHDAGKHAIDPGNRYFWRMKRRTLEVEAWRDAMLAVSGSLKPNIGGPPLSLADPNNQRRTLYGSVHRRELDDMLRLYDFPDPVAHSPGRIPTVTPLQQLFTLNSPFPRQQAVALVHRLEKEVPGSDEQRVQRMYLLLFGRPATIGQVKIGLDFLGVGPDKPERWQQYAQALLGSNEFLFVD